MKNLLILIKEAYIREIATGDIGICGVLYILQERNKTSGGVTISGADSLSIRKMIKEEAQSKKVFYTYGGAATDEEDQFLWPVKDHASRIEWLDQKINELN